MDQVAQLCPEPGTGVKAANLALKFGLEVVAIAAFAYWGANLAAGVRSVLAGILAPLVAVILWGTLAAPRARRRLATRARVPLELSVFALATLALLTASSLAAIVFASAAAINAICLTAFGQWAE